MTADELLEVVRRAGIVLKAHGDKLHVEAPAGTLTPRLREQLLAQKPALLERLTMRFVALKGGLVVPLPALLLALDLERRGVPLQTDADHQLVVPDDARLTAFDRAGLDRWHQHVAALVEYRVPVL